ncbi:Di-copper centre-containing protein [Hypoxylon fuscum]|nr:Di-copper centre-containing protein [Hypoxylon fuscum]
MKVSVALFVTAVSAATIPSAKQGLPLEQFGEVHHISIEDAINKVDLIGNNFTLLPISTLLHKDKKPSPMGEEKVTSSKATTAAAADTGDCANPNIRFEWDHYSASDKQAFVDALQCLVNKPPSGKFSPSKNRYEDFVRLHQTYSPNIHSPSTDHQTHKFLLWHRYYVWALEQVMRDECGFNRAFPWWDEKKWAGKFSQATIFTNQYFGNLPGSTNGAATCINSGRFSGMQLSLGPGMATNNPHCLQRAVNEQTTAQTGTNSWNTCMSRTSYPDFHSCVEFTFHAQGHNGMGGIMADAIASPGDPAFFMHHLFVDYAFRKWQIDDVSRRTTISGCADSANCSPLTLDTVVYMGNICGSKCPDLKVRDILNTLNGHFCYRYDY